MAARLIVPESRRRAVQTAVALIMVAVLLAAGCASQSLNNQDRSLLGGKYVLLEHQINETTVTTSGLCHPTNILCSKSPQSTYFFKENYGVLNITDQGDQNELINGSLLLFFGRQYLSDQNPCIHANTGMFLYSLPGQFDNVTVESVSEN
jgi:hypothetical protein